MSLFCVKRCQPNVAVVSEQHAMCMFSIGAIGAIGAIGCHRCMARGGNGLLQLYGLKYQSGPPLPILLLPAGQPHLKRPYGRFRGGTPACARPALRRPSSTPLYIPRRILMATSPLPQTKSGREFLTEVTWCSIPFDVNTWSGLYFMGYRRGSVWYHITRACHCLQLYTLQAANPCPA
jgi:hypothetical protein